MYISIGSSPMIDIIYGLPSDISIGPSSTIDIYFFFCGLPFDQLLFLDNPLKPLSLELPHALTPIVLGYPSAYGNA